MKIAGLQKLTLLDFPGHTACTLFTLGCNFRCGFCHNPELVVPTKQTALITEQNFFRFLESRKNLLDAVCITGGEPTIQKDLPKFIREIKKMNFKVKLDTNGTNPDMIQKLISQNLVDYLAMDLKASFKNYQKVVGVQVNLQKIQKSIQIIKESKIPHQFRTTVVPGLHNNHELIQITKNLSNGSHYRIQNFQKLKKCLNPKFNKIIPFSQNEFSELERFNA